MVVAVAIALVSFVPERAASPSTPLAAAWSAFGANRLPLDQPPDDRAIRTLIGSGAAAPDLTGLDLKVASVGSLRLAGQPAVGAEYRGSAGERLAFFRWRGQLPQAAEDYQKGAAPQLQTSSWGPTQSAWWEHDGLVYCLVGTLDEPSFDKVVARIQQTA
jgi:hypothetical protein